MVDRDAGGMHVTDRMWMFLSNSTIHDEIQGTISYYSLCWAVAGQLQLLYSGLIEFE